MSSDKHFDGAVAVVGLACRVPGAESPDELWRILRSGEDSISRFTDEELLAAGVPLEQIRSPTYVPAKGIVEDADSFDAGLFGLSPREAALTDPQQRIFLECAWTALEDAGYDPRRFPEPVGVFAGSILSVYLLQNLWSNPQVRTAAGNFQLAVGNDPTFLATSTSYHLDLRGPSVSVGTACSTSLVAVHLACQSLLAHECDLALAGGVSVHLPLVAGYHYENEGILSPDGRCRPFSADAAGTVSSDGAGVVVLKRLAEALADGDTIRSVIRASAVNNDGRSKVGYTAPSVAGEAQVIEEALAMAGVEPRSLVMVETHGAGTLLGDPIEVEALKQAFGEVSEQQFCALGSIKANLGHLDAAAGIAGLIKATLALEHREIPPVPHFDTPNPRLELESSPFYVNEELRQLPDDRPLRVGVNSFGIGGTNAHVILEQAPSPPPSTDPVRSHDLLVLSARSAGALERTGERMASFLEDPATEPADADFADICFTLREGRRQLEHRRAVVCRNAAEAASLLRSGDTKRSASGTVSDAGRSVAFMLPGLGDNYPAMGWQLYCEEPSFRAVIDHCSELLTPFLPGDLRDSLYPDRNWSDPAWRPEAGAGGSDGLDLAAMIGRSKTPSGPEEPKEPKEPENPPIVAQPMIFVTELALAQLLLGWGIEPRAMIGHSIGELAVACCAGVFDLPQALELVAERARLIQERVSPGAMLAVPLAEQELRPLLPDGVDLGAVNGSALCVASGEIEGIEALEASLAERKVQCRRLRSSRAYHSRMLETIREPLAALVRRLEPSPPETPWVSCSTGDWITDEQATDPEYWARHACATVRFEDGVKRLLEDPDRILLEVGPGQGLTSYALGARGKDPERRTPILPTMRWSYDARPESEVLLAAVAQLWVAGVELDGRTFLARGGARRVPLPTYPFERRRHWIDAGESPTEVAGRDARVTTKNPDLSRWFYLPAWKPSVAPAAASTDGSWGGDWLLLADRRSPAWLSALAEGLTDAGCRIVRVEPGESFSWTDERATVAPGRTEEFADLVCALGERDLRPTRVIHAWTLTEEDPAAPSDRRFAELRDRGFGGLTALIQSLSRQDGGLGGLRLDILTDHLYAVDGHESLVPEKSTLEALCLVAPQEHPGLICRCVDVGDAAEIPDDERVELLLRELGGSAAEASVAYRRGRRWIRSYEPVELPAAEESPSLRRRGVYLITGGLGGVGLVLARFLASRFGARLALLGRTVLPDRERWPAISEATDADETIRAKIRAVQELEASGAEVLVLSADVADGDAMEAAIQRIYERFGDLHGVIHGAGLPGVDAFREIVRASPADAEAQFRAKVHGLLQLDRALGDRPLDFCVLMSSLSAVLGGLGFAGYSAANLFLDAFATWKRRAASATDGHQTPWISIDWESWRQPGAEPVIRGLGATVSDLTMEPEEGTDALVRILAQPRLSQVVVSCGDLQARLDQWTVQERAEPAAGESHVHERPELSSAYVAPRNELERQLAAIWRELFGLADVGVEDDFFDLGGHSLLATQLNARIYSVLGVEMSLATLLRTPTIAELAVTVAEHQLEQSDPAELETLVAEISALSAEESQRMLAEESAD